MTTPGILTIWWLAIRPKTLSISVTPVLLGNALAWHDQQHISLMVFFLTLFSALCIQVGTNLYNDAADFEKGADTSSRLGPRRAAQQGWLNARQLKNAALVSFTLAFASGIYLAWTGGWPIILLGIIAILCGYAYTGGPKPIAYSPLGELFVLLFFGLAAVSGSYYLQTLSINIRPLLISTTIGSIAAAILLVNNYRDLDSDKKVNKLTLVYYIGRPAAKIIYAFMLGYPYILLFALTTQYSWLVLLPLLSLPLAINITRQFMSMDISSTLNKILAQTAQLQLIYAILLLPALILFK